MLDAHSYRHNAVLVRRPAHRRARGRPDLPRRARGDRRDRDVHGGTAHEERRHDEERGPARDAVHAAAAGAGGWRPDRRVHAG